MKAIPIVVIACALASVLCCAAAEASSETVLYSFSGGEYPYAGVIDIEGVLYGTTAGALDCQGSPCGTVYSLNLETDAETILHSFQTAGNDGWNPEAGVIKVKGTLYGTTEFGGGGSCQDTNSGCGTLFSVDLKTGAEKVLHAFSNSGGDGTFPLGSLINVGGMLYGTTMAGGTGSCEDGCGTVFSFDPKTEVETVYSFDSAGDGASPAAGLVNVKGTLYGTTSSGGASGAGTVFSLDLATGAETLLHSFQNDEVDGWYPVAGLIDVKGTLYGTTAAGGGGSCFQGCGTVFSLNRKTGALTVLHAFQATDGQKPLAGLVDVKGVLFGTTSSGGASGAGTVFSLDLATGAETLLHSFQNDGVDGWYPVAGLIDVKGTLYGTTAAGGGGSCFQGCGTVFSVVP